ncbi:MAG: hypothetical protein EZS28_032721, partial [Streblomastix strix]
KAVALQQIIALIIISGNWEQVALASEIEGKARILLSQSPNDKIKKLSNLIISMIGHREKERIDNSEWETICQSLTELLFYANEKLSTTGKDALIILIEQCEKVISILLKQNFISRSTDELKKIIPVAQQASREVEQELPPHDVIINIMDVVGTFIRVGKERMNKISDLREILEKIESQQEMDEISQKAKQVLEILGEKGNTELMEDEMKQIKLQLIQEQQKVHEAEQARKEEQQKRIEAEQARNEEERRRIEAEQAREEEERRRKQIEDDARRNQQPPVNNVPPNNNQEQRRSPNTWQRIERETNRIINQTGKEIARTPKNIGKFFRKIF